VPRLYLRQNRQSWLHWATALVHIPQLFRVEALHLSSVEIQAVKAEALEMGSAKPYWAVENAAVRRDEVLPARLAAQVLVELGPSGGGAAAGARGHAEGRGGLQKTPCAGP
jgi:hypothetical protein